MCGICGFSWRDEDLMHSMLDSLRHRGPDGGGLHVSGGISIGHRRLSIIDLSECGKQPMPNEDETIWVTYNGEVYNFLELRRTLEKQGHTFRSDTDTEVIIHAYEEWGVECFNRLNGMWAFCIYDKKNNILLLSRDRFGIKPLYYHHDAGKFAFASEIRALLSIDVKVEPNDKLIHDFLLHNITDHTDETFFSPIKRLPKASYAVYDINKHTLNINVWWVPEKAEKQTVSYPVAVQKLKELLTDSVNIELRSDVPVGTCLSGGLDSSTIACLIDSSKQASIKTFSAVYNDFKHDESSYIDIVSQQKLITNYKTYPSQAISRAELYDLINAQGEPVPGPSSYAHYCVMRLVKENNVTVLLDGQGSDEILAGYHYFYGFYLKGLLRQTRLGIFLREVMSLISGGEWKFGFSSFIFLMLPHKVRDWYLLRKSNINPEFHATHCSDYSARFYSCLNLKEAIIFHLNHKLEHLLIWVDHNSMYFSKESRVPFLDYRIVEFILGLPEDYLIGSGLTKRILRDAMVGTVPAEILARRDKIGFATPEDDWLRKPEVKVMLEDYFQKSKPLCYPYINLEKTKNLIQRHQAGQNHGRIIWRTLFLEIWMKTFFKDSVPRR